ncbi:FAD dependent oxidoreductase [Plectosphaerella plurivora]|uniref:FAD dependent oxidoreductase n=1 Tax=Plectosphaerella plurivora TaxID=936078 RepID=A0A9P9A396_9PEZI|nr:FAD dependent oxidoreductase [Plectosphaerella plurivora]
MHIRNAALAASFIAEAAAAARDCSKCTKTIQRDVAVIGGGAAGAHAAVWLRDHDRSVVVVEKASQLGGHTDAYTDPVSGKKINVGVQAWMEYGNAFDFPHRMNVSTSGGMEFTTLDYNFVDFTNGRPVADYVAPGPGDMYPALQRYLDVLEQYEPMILPGFDGFPDAESIPEDLLMPFGEFVAKYDLAAAVPQIWDSTAQGLGDTMNVPALWVFQASGVPMVRALLGQAAAAVPASGRLYELFESVAAFLGDDVLYSSTVVSSKRAETDGVSLVVEGPDGVTCVEAKRLLIAFEPTTEDLKPFDTDAAEADVFDRFSYATVYAGILRHPSLKVGNAYSNRVPASTSYTVFPTASQVGRIDYIGGTEDLFQFTAVGTESDTTESIKALIAETINTMIEAGTLPASNGTLSFAAFANHGKMHPHVSREDLLDGFIQRQLALQGKRSTWFTGAAFSAGFSTVLWEYNEQLLPRVIEGI